MENLIKEMEEVARKNREKLKAITIDDEHYSFDRGFQLAYAQATERWLQEIKDLA